MLGDRLRRFFGVESLIYISVLGYFCLFFGVAMMTVGYQDYKTAMSIQDDGLRAEGEVFVIEPGEEQDTINIGVMFTDENGKPLMFREKRPAESAKDIKLGDRLPVKYLHPHPELNASLDTGKQKKMPPIAPIAAGALLAVVGFLIRR